MERNNRCIVPWRYNFCTVCHDSFKRRKTTVVTERSRKISYQIAEPTLVPPPRGLNAGSGVHHYPCTTQTEPDSVTWLPAPRCGTSSGSRSSPGRGDTKFHPAAQSEAVWGSVGLFTWVPPSPGEKLRVGTRTFHRPAPRTKLSRRRCNVLILTSFHDFHRYHTTSRLIFTNCHAPPNPK
ncbi:unnamed protein product [Pleuronectes platessa]|uniref:Uncharacterized protein n=1 Tax=Pleuronectes platessa TaxID=8262 RepID=A0A9N7ZCG2_PLEPL|nr:unnamed protein product [Pleuronectes platessa]